MVITAIIIVVLIVLLFVTSAFWVNWWWFGSMGYRSVLTTRYLAELATFVIGGLVALLIFGGNIVIALRRTRTNRQLGAVARFGDRVLSALIFGGSLAVFVIAGLWSASRWQMWLLWLHGRDFGIKDPIFHRDAGFYVFALPAFRALRTGLLAVVVVTALAIVLVYAVRLSVGVRNIRSIPATMRVHLFALGGAMLLVLAGSYLIANYDLLYSTRGYAFGPGYTDVNVQRITNWLLAALSVIAAVLLLVNAFVKRVKLLIGVVVLWGVLSLILGVLLPTAVERTLVEPSQLKRERPYIANNIEMTRAAYGLDDVANRDISGQEPVQQAVLDQYPDTVSNIRLWDYRIIQTTLQQLQSFVPYYVFSDVDVERYIIDGKPTAVLLSAREIDQDGLPVNARTWTNERLVYTHGYAVVVSPVSGVSKQGLPTFLVQDIPPTGTGPLKINQPEIYFGAGTTSWVITNTEQKEFNGLDTAGPSRPYAGAGRGTISLKNPITKLLVAANLGQRNIFLSGDLTSASRIHLHREISDRVSTIAPWLTLDSDPSLIIYNGRLYWIIDSYTSTSLFPGATRTDGINYLRNSVKVVIDAYNGTTTFYRTTTPDPIADAYSAIYGDLLKPVSEASPGIAAHFRYPEKLFDLQSRVYTDYHVTDPTDFYNGEDRWSVPLEQVNSEPTTMEAFYVEMTLPGDTASNFTLIRPFIPGGRTNRQNMTAWMAGQTTDDGALRLVNYRFPRQETVFGPRQIDARISQDPQIASQINLWNQSGSRVIRGNMLVIPIKNSILYVQPLYLEATGTEASLPELRQVIVASSDGGVVMRDTLDQALSALTSENAPTTGPIQPAEPANTGTTTQQPPPATSNVSVAALTQQALDAYNRAQAALKTGDWDTYGREQATLKQILDQLATATGGAPATPVPAATPTP
jgi:uncharacterized membrane protein (UPF0182 family)